MSSKDNSNNENNSRNVADGIGAPDPDPRHLVSWRL